MLLDPFNRGALLTVETCGEVVRRALGRPVRLQAEHFTPVTNRQFLVRVLANLKGIYWRQEAWDKVVRVIDRPLRYTLPRRASAATAARPGATWAGSIAGPPTGSAT